MLTSFHRPVILLLAALTFYGHSLSAAQAAPSLVNMDIDTSSPVVHVSLHHYVIPDTVRQALQEGTSITFTWYIAIERQQDYWLNDFMGEIVITRRATPNLITRTWSLSDSASGNVLLYTSELRDALDFLVPVHDFPVIERSLLEPQQRYTISTKLLMQKGENPDQWWNKLLQLPKTIASETMSTP